VIAFVVNLVRIVVVLLILRLVLRFLAAVVLGYQGAPPRVPAATEMVRDRVCDTFVPRSRALMAVVDGREQYFCSPECRERARRRIATT
jgi:YHS domain-containing protein